MRLARPRKATFWGDMMTGRFSVLCYAVLIGLLLAAAAPPEVRARGGRSQAWARQRVAHALARATADGRLTPARQHAILAMAKETLSPSEFEYFERTVRESERYAGREAATRPSRAVPPEETVPGLPAPDADPSPAIHAVNAPPFEHHQRLRQPRAAQAPAHPNAPDHRRAGTDVKSEAAPRPDDVAYDSPARQAFQPVSHFTPLESRPASWGAAPRPGQVGSRCPTGCPCGKGDTTPANEMTRAPAAPEPDVAPRDGHRQTRGWSIVEAAKNLLDFSAVK